MNNENDASAWVKVCAVIISVSAGVGLAWSIFS